MDRRPDNRDEETLAAEHAVEWLHRLDAADAGDKAAFRKWLIRSPQNGGEVLAATVTDVVVRELLRDKRIDVNQFLSAATNVHTIGDELRSREQPAPPKRLRRWIGMGLAAAQAVVAIAPIVERNLFRPDEYSTSTGEQRGIDGAPCLLEFFPGCLTESPLHVQEMLAAQACHVELKKGRISPSKLTLSDELTSEAGSEEEPPHVLRNALLEALQILAASPRSAPAVD